MDTRVKYIVFEFLGTEEIHLILESLGGKDRRKKVLNSLGEIEILKLNKLNNYRIVKYNEDPIEWTRINNQMTKYLIEEVDRSISIVNNINKFFFNKLV